MVLIIGGVQRADLLLLTICLFIYSELVVFISYFFGAYFEKKIVE